MEGSDVWIAYRQARPDHVDAAFPLLYSAGATAYDYVFSVTHVAGAQNFLRWPFLVVRLGLAG
jgi:hypothetical protein